MKNKNLKLKLKDNTVHRFFPESPRWLIAHDRLDEAQTVIERFGGKKAKPVNAEELGALLEKVRRHQLEREREAKKYTPIDLFRTPKLRKWTVIICYQWYEYNNNDILTKVNAVNVFRITYPLLKL